MLGTPNELEIVKLPDRGSKVAVLTLLLLVAVDIVPVLNIWFIVLEGEEETT